MTDCRLWHLLLRAIPPHPVVPLLRRCPQLELRLTLKPHQVVAQVVQSLPHHQHPPHSRPLVRESGSAQLHLRYLQPCTNITWQTTSIVLNRPLGIARPYHPCHSLISLQLPQFRQFRIYIRTLRKLSQALPSLCPIAAVAPAASVRAASFITRFRGRGGRHLGLIMVLILMLLPQAPYLSRLLSRPLFTAPQARHLRIMGSIQKDVDWIARRVLIMKAA